MSLVFRTATRERQRLEGQQASRQVLSKEVP
jgi:hypothetical protein